MSYNFYKLEKIVAQAMSSELIYFIYRSRRDVNNFVLLLLSWIVQKCWFLNRLCQWIISAKIFQKGHSTRIQQGTVLNNQSEK